MANKEPCVYMMANKKNGTLYIGVTSSLSMRIYQHKTGQMKGFTSRHGCKNLVWYEYSPTMDEAITREKQIKAGSRKRKILLIERLNPEWNDLYESLA